VALLAIKNQFADIT